MKAYQVVLSALSATLLSSLFAVWTSTVSSSSTTPSPSNTTLLIQSPTVRLHNGLDMPILQLGCAQLINEHGMRAAPDRFLGMMPELTYRQVQVALEVGVRAFDTAAIYRTQRQLGKVLADWWQTGNLTRANVWITTKIFHPRALDVTPSSHMPELSSMSVEEVTQQVRLFFERSLDDIGVGYVDLMLLHWPGEKNAGTAEDNRRRRLAAWQVLEDMYRQGWARAIGVSNFSPTHLEQLIEDGAAIVPMVNQFEASVSLQYRELLDYCHHHNIVPQAYSPMGRGILELPAAVGELATKYNKDVGQICFRYLYQLGYAIVYLTHTRSRMISNTHLFDFELTPSEMEWLSSFHRPDGGWGLPSPYDIE